MKVNKKTSVEGTWAKIGKDIKDGDRIKILDSGNIVEGDFGPRKVFKIMTLKKAEFLQSFNQTSLNNLIDAWGDETEEWEGKVIKAFVIKQMVGDGLKNVCYFAPENWTMDDEGKFINPDNDDNLDPDKIDKAINEADEEDTMRKNSPF